MDIVILAPKNLSDAECNRKMKLKSIAPFARVRWSFTTWRESKGREQSKKVAIALPGGMKETEDSASRCQIAAGPVVAAGGEGW
jgi:hypothetical protein